MARNHPVRSRFFAGLAARAAGPIAAFAFLCGATGTGRCQLYPAEGYVGVYFDRAGTQICGLAPVYAMSDLYIIATLMGSTSAGIAGADFRLEFSSTAGYFLTFEPVPCACLVLGNPVDRTACIDDAAGISLAFAQCQTSDPILGSGRVYLGKIHLFNVAGGAVSIQTKRQNPVSNPDFMCPLFVLCDTPNFTRVCTTLQDGDPRLGGLEPVSFRTVVNSNPDPCAGPPDCVRVGIATRPWSLVKSLYRDAGR